jgi:hypothetical protein
MNPAALSGSAASLLLMYALRSDKIVNPAVTKGLCL